MIQAPRDLDPKFSELLAALERPSGSRRLLDDVRSVEALQGLRPPSDDSRANRLHTEAMDYVPRPELDAKFERTEARVDARLAGFEQRVADQLGAMAADLREVRVEVAHLKGIKTQVWAAAGTAIAITVGSIWAAWALGFGAFESGRNTATTVRDAQEKIEKASSEMAKQRDEIARQQEETRKILQEAIKAISNQQPQSPPEKPQ